MLFGCPAITLRTSLLNKLKTFFFINYFINLLSFFVDNLNIEKTLIINSQFHTRRWNNQAGRYQRDLAGPKTVILKSSFKVQTTISFRIPLTGKFSKSNFLSVQRFEFPTTPVHSTVSFAFQSCVCTVQDWGFFRRRNYAYVIWKEIISTIKIKKVNLKIEYEGK